MILCPLNKNRTKETCIFSSRNLKTYKIIFLQKRIDIQRQKIQRGNPFIELSHSCRINNGVNQLSLEEQNEFIKLYEAQLPKLVVTHFIPASGSGSRMFDALFDYLQNPHPFPATINFIEEFKTNLKEFAFYDLIPLEVKTSFENGKIDLTNLIRFLLFAKVQITGNEIAGFNFGEIPKGLIPFHKNKTEILNAFQEHIIQGISISGIKSNFHFTINEKFEKQISDSIQSVNNLTETHLSFSHQLKETNAITFDEKLEPVKDESGELITRPAGHGAILSNLNKIDADIIFIRNIDNVQHSNKSSTSIQSRKTLTGILINLQEIIFEILHDIEIKTDYEEKILELNKKFDLQIPKNKLSEADFIFDLLNRPIRVCGMVKNEGQPGGGPFWVVDENGGYERRQIVEKSQMSDNPFQFAEMIKSTHFNPVELVCSFKNFKGDKFDLNDFKNDNHYFIVDKTHQGKPIKYIEETGLWNGGMEKWTTLFYEIESDCFSPVKTVLDLLKPLHRG